MAPKYEMVPVQHGPKAGMFQILALRDFGNISAGDLGGYVSKECNLSHRGNCWLYGNSAMYGNSRMFDNSRMYGNSIMYGNSQMFDDSAMYGNSKMYGNSIMYGNSAMYGNSQMHGNSILVHSACLRDKMQMHKKVPQLVTSDSYTMLYLADQDTLTCGCRTFTWQEAHAHWTKTRGRTALGAERLAMLEFLKSLA